MADVELHRHKLTHLALEIAEKFNIPIASTLLSKSVLSEDHPLYIGTYSGSLTEEACKKYVENSDCILMLGTFLSDVLHGFMADYKKLERRNSIMITTQVARVGYRHYEDVRLDDFLNHLKDAPVKPRNKFNNPAERIQLLPLSANELNKSLDVESMFRILSLNSGDNSTFVCDTGDTVFGAIDIRTRNQQSFIADAYYLSMGFSIPASIGVMAANAEAGNQKSKNINTSNEQRITNNNTLNSTEKTFILVGDGAFQMTGMELSTAIRCGFAPVVIIFNNDGYGTQRFIIDGKFNDILRWNYTRITDVFGHGKSVQVHTNAEFQQAIQQSLSEKELFIIEAMISRDACSRALRSVGEGLKKARMSTNITKE